jgi:hypothetical protein
MFTSMVLIGVGALFIWLGVHGLVRKTYMNAVPFIEAVIMRAAGEDPRPREPWERSQYRVHLWLTLIVGSIATGLGFVGLAGG